MVDEFVSKVNVALQHQDEVEKVKNVAQRLKSIGIFHHIPSGWEKVIAWLDGTSHLIVATLNRATTDGVRARSFMLVFSYSRD